MLRNLFLLALLCYSYVGVGSELHQAALNGDVNLIQQLIGEGHDPFLRDENGHTPLEVAVRQGHADATRFLLESDAVNHMEFLFDAVEHVDVEMFDIAVQNVEDINDTNEHGNTPLHHAFYGYLESTNQLVNDNKEEEEDRKNRISVFFYMSLDLLLRGADRDILNEDQIRPIDVLDDLDVDDPLRVLLNM